MGFIDRHDAGRQLAGALLGHPPADPVVIGIGRGGVPVAAEIAHALDAPLDLCIVRKVMSSGSPAFAIGAVAEGGGVCLDPHAIAELAMSAVAVTRAVELERAEIDRVAEQMRDGPPMALRGRDAVLVDDGLAEPARLRAAILSVRSQQPRTITLAIPVGNLVMIEQLRRELDRVVCLVTEPMVGAGDARYRDFAPVSEIEVVALISAARGPAQLQRW
jgi:putative phosphoribosyl transferase